MRSRKASPGFTDTRTTSQSDSTRVPPVTAEKSPPDSRMTGADSPVIALSSTEATPSITSPSAGTISPASTSTVMPRRKSSEGTVYHSLPRFASFKRFAHVFCFMPRNDAAWALLRPSANASAKLANSTVNHSHNEMARIKPQPASPLPFSAWKKRMVVMMLPT